MPSDASRLAKSLKPGKTRLDWRNLSLLFVVYVAVAFLWETPFLYPLRILVVMFHEIGHGLAAAATGGTIEEIQIFSDEGGHCVTRGGNRFLILSAGYLGSLVAGAAILLLACRTQGSRLLSAGIGVMVLAVSVLYVPLVENTFGRLFGVGTGVVLVLLAFVPRVWSRMAMTVLGVTSCLYAILDIKSDVLDSSDPRSDAAQLAQLTFVPALVWGLLWIAISIVCTVYVVKWAVSGDPDGRGSPEGR